MSESNWSKLLKAFQGKQSVKSSRSYGLEELMKVVKGGKTKPAERLEPSETLMERSELLYRMEPLIFSGINKLTRRITGSRVFFAGKNETENQLAWEFFEKCRAYALMPHLVKDAFIYGFGVAEMTLHTEGLVLTQIYPKELDYQRTGGKVDVKPNGEIKGFIWKKDGGAEKEPLAPEQVLLIRFYALGDYSIGISPIEAAFKSAWIKLNISEALGEATYRTGTPTQIFYLGTPEQGPWHEVTPEKVKQAREILKVQDTGSQLILPWWMRADQLKSGDVTNVTPLLELLSMEILGAMEMPKAFSTQTKGVGGRAVEEMDYERTILAMQEELKRQYHEQLLDPYYEKMKFKTKPQLTFTEYAPEIQNIKLRRLSAYAKHGLITRTDELENKLRTEEGFPLKQKLSEVPSTECIFGLGKCQIRAEEKMPLDKLANFCNICLARLREEKNLKKEGQVRQVVGSDEEVRVVE